MSRGLGVWQRGILTAVEHFGMVYIRDLLQDDARKSERNAIERAAWRLTAARRIEMVEFWFGRPRLLAVRPGLTFSGRPKPAAQRPVGEIPSRNLAHTYAQQSGLPADRRLARRASYASLFVTGAHGEDAQDERQQPAIRSWSSLAATES